MTAIIIADGLPMVGVTLYANSRSLSLPRVVVDTGASDSLFRTDDLRTLGFGIEPTDIAQAMRGIGGREWVVEKQIDRLEIERDFQVRPFTIQIGALDYGLAIDGILGMDFLVAAKAIIDLDALTLTRRRI